MTEDTKRPAIPTTYRGVRFRSRLEAAWAAFFDLELDGDIAAGVGITVVDGHRRITSAGFYLCGLCWGTAFSPDAPVHCLLCGEVVGPGDGVYSETLRQAEPHLIRAMFAAARNRVQWRGGV